MSIISILLIFLIPLAVFPQEEGEFKVLVLNSYHEGYHWADNVMAGVRDVFCERSDIEVYIEYMDTKRHSQHDYFEMLAELYSYKYSGITLDAVLSTDDHALNFLMKYRAELFPEVPLVFTGINDFDPSIVEGQQDITGTSESYDMNANLELILSLHPEIETVVIILDDTVTGQAMTARLRRIEPHFTDRIELDYWMNLSPEEMTGRLSKLGDSAVVLWGIYLRMPSGEYLSTSKSLRMIKDASSNPIYCIWDVVGLGVVGGYVTDPHYIGSHASERVLQILSGTDADDLPFDESPMSYIFDYRELKSNNINFSSLPRNGIIRNRPFSFIREYPLLFSMSVALTALLTSALNELENKIYSIALVHSRLDETEDFTNVEIKGYVEELSQLIASSYFDCAKAVVVDLEVENIKINFEITVSIGFILNELMTNSYKHAFSGGGIIRIALFRNDDMVTIDYSDNGRGVPEDHEMFGSGSFGLLTVKDIVEHQLGGTMTIDKRSGLRFLLNIKEQLYKTRI